MKDIKYVNLAVEPVVKPRNDRSDDEDCDAAVVQPVEETTHIWRVTQHGVVQGRARQAQESAPEEEQKDDLIKGKIESILKIYK